MEMQLKKVTKEQAHRMIDEVEGDTVFILSYNKNEGVSNNGKHVSKKKGNKVVSQSDEIELFENELTKVLNLYKEHKCFDIFNRDNIVKTILLPKLEQNKHTFGKTC